MYAKLIKREALLSIRYYKLGVENRRWSYRGSRKPKIIKIFWF